ncbi:hypothetical protein ACIF70_40480 [Actinacidiphila glaucinigra]|uniref:hypothetical protein n=1 Tax=Actinacidiphila glaucinigra TaxID=235986 RepID=UPI0037C5CCA6
MDAATPLATVAVFCDGRIVNVIGDIAAIRHPLPRPQDVTPPEQFPDALEQVERARAQEAMSLEAASDGLEADPLLVALSDARARRRAAEAEVRRLLAYGRAFHGSRPYRLEDLAEASGMTPSGVRTAFGEAELDFVTEQVGRAPDARTARRPKDSATDGR